MRSFSSRKLYDLAGCDIARRTSPYCWRIRFALAYKQLQYETIPWRRVDKGSIAFTGQGKVPVLVDGDGYMYDSWQIAKYLDKHHGIKPLLGNKTEEAAIKLLVDWVDSALLKVIRNIVALGAIEVSADKDKEFYCDKLQAVHGVNLQSAGSTAANMEALQSSLEEMRAIIKDQLFLGGQKPNFADLAVGGAFAWARSVSPIVLLRHDDPMYAWRQRLFGMFQEDLSITLGYPVG